MLHVRELNTNITQLNSDLEGLELLGSVKKISVGSQPIIASGFTLSDYKSVYISYGIAGAEKSIVKIPIALLTNFTYLPFYNTLPTDFVVYYANNSFNVYDFATTNPSWTNLGSITIYGCKTV